MQTAFSLHSVPTASPLPQRIGATTGNLQAALKRMVIGLSMPALILSQVHPIRLDLAALCSMSMPWLLFLTEVGSFALIALALSLTPDIVGSLLLMAGLSSHAVLGVFLHGAFTGDDAPPAVALTGQLGTCLVLWTIALTIACVRRCGPANVGTTLVRILSFPPAVALVVAVALNGVPYPSWVGAPLALLGATVAPLALLCMALRPPLCQLRG